MTFTAAVRTCLRKYITFSGRASRSEYWWFFLFLVLGNFLAATLDGVLFGTGRIETSATDTSASFTAEANGPVAALFSIATFLPTLSAGWRRMHDSGRSGLYLLYPLIAMLGFASFIGLIAGFDTLASGNFDAALTGGLGIVIVLALLVLALSPLIVLWWLTRPSTPGPNRYGPNPHEVFQ